MGTKLDHFGRRPIAFGRPMSARHRHALHRPCNVASEQHARALGQAAGNDGFGRRLLGVVAVRNVDLRHTLHSAHSNTRQSRVPVRIVRNNAAEVSDTMRHGAMLRIHTEHGTSTSGHRGRRTSSACDWRATWPRTPRLPVRSESENTSEREKEKERENQNRKSKSE